MNDIEPNYAYTLSKNENTYEIIYYSDDKFKISKTNNNKKISIKIESSTKHYNITIENNNEKTIKSFDNKNIISDTFKLDKKVALDNARTVLGEIKNINILNKYVDVNNILKLLRINKKNEYNIIIKDDTISLSSKSIEIKNNINNTNKCVLDIILNKTYEVVGFISFDLDNRCPGNVSYIINEQYQHNGYATKALKLLKELLKQNKYKNNKDIYLQICNEYSRKVAIKNGAVYQYQDINNPVYKIKI